MQGFANQERETLHHKQDEDVREVWQELNGHPVNAELDEETAEYEETVTRSLG